MRASVAAAGGSPAPCNPHPRGPALTGGCRAGRPVGTVTTSRPTLTLKGLFEGATLLLPILPGLVVYGLAFGAAAAHRGVSLVEAVALSGIVYAGAAQMVSLEVWRESWTIGGVLTVALITATVNARFVLMGASLQPWLRGTPPLTAGSWLFFLVDANWLIASRYRESGGRDIGVFLGAGLLSWVLWVLATIPGHMAGTLVAEPRRYALDLVMPIFFAAMAVPLWRGVKASGRPWAVAGATALVVGQVAPGYAFIVAGALAGALTAAFTEPTGE